MSVLARSPLRLALVVLVLLAPVGAAQDPAAYAAEAVGEAAADPAGFAKRRVDDPGRDAAFVLCLAHRATGITPDTCPLPPAPSDEPAAQPEPVGPIEEPAARAEDVADAAQEAVERIAEDPTAAPDALAGLVATVRQFVTDLLAVPVAAVESVSGVARGVAAGALAAVEGAVGAGGEARDATLGAFDAAAAAAKNALAHGLDAVSSSVDVAVDAVKGAVETVQGLLASSRQSAVDRRVPDAGVGSVETKTTGLLDGALGLLG